MSVETSPSRTTENRKPNQVGWSFDELADFLPDAMLILDTSLQILFLNSAAEAMFGYSSEQAGGQDIDILIPEQFHQTHIVSASLLAQEAGSVHRMGNDRHIYGKHRDGHLIPLDISITRRKWHDQNFVLCVLRDISHEIAAERASSESENRFRAIFMEHNAVMLLVEPKSGLLLEANAAACKFYGYSREQLTSMSVDQINIMSPDQVAAERAHALIKNKNFFNFQHKLVTGEVRDVEVYSTPIDSGGKTVLFSIIHDVTERKRMEVALQQITERLSLATRAGGIGIWDWDIVNNKLIWDDIMYSLYGITSEQFVGIYDAWQAGLHPDDRGRGDEEIQMALRGEKEFDTQFRVVWPDGSIQHIRGLALVQRDDSGQPVRMIGTNWNVTSHKETERELSNKIALLSGLLDSIPDIVYFKDNQGKYLGCDLEFSRLVGKSINEIVGYADDDLFDRESADLFRKNDRIVIDQGIEHRSEEWVDYPDGRKVLLDTHKTSLRDSYGTAIGLLGISRDITERKAAEDARFQQTQLLEYRNKFEEILTSISTRLISLSSAEIDPEINHVLTQIGEFEQVDRSYVFLFDRDAGQMSNTHEWCAAGIEPEINNLQNIPLGTFPWWMEKLEKLEEVYIPIVSELPQEAHNEREILEMQSIQSVLVIPLIRHNTLVGFLGLDSVSRQRFWTPDSILLIKMVSEILSNALMRKQMENDLLQSEARNRALLSAIPDLIFRIRRDGIILDFTAKSNNLLAIPSDQIIGSLLSTVLESTVTEKVMACIEQALKTREIQTLEYTLKIRDSSHVFEARFIDSGLDEVMTIIRDVSDRARLEQMKSDFINRATHELRTPIATMLLMINLIDGGAPEDEYKEYWDVLKSELNRERMLIEDLLSASRLESDHLPLRFSSIDVTELLNDAVHQFELLARDKNLSIRLCPAFDTEDDRPQINADQKAIAQVFINLIGNAIKFTPAGGNINISLKRKDQGVGISIRDTGIGIPSEDLPLLFTRFFRGTNAIEEEIQGTGIGLFIVKSILEKHGGNIQVSSEVGKGSQFDVWLPAIKRPA